MFCPFYPFRLGFGAGLNHWNSRLQPQTFHISVIIRGCEASWEKLLVYEWLHRWEQLWHCRLGAEDTQKLRSCGAQSRTAGYTDSSSAALGCSLKKTGDKIPFGVWRNCSDWKVEMKDRRWRLSHSTAPAECKALSRGEEETDKA